MPKRVERGLRMGAGLVRVVPLRSRRDERVVPIKIAQRIGDTWIACDQNGGIFVKQRQGIPRHAACVLHACGLNLLRLACIECGFGFGEREPNGGIKKIMQIEPRWHTTCIKNVRFIGGLRGQAGLCNKMQGLAAAACVGADLLIQGAN